MKTGRHSSKGNGVVYVFTLVGKGPYKEEKLEIPTTAALLVADRVLSIAGKQTVPPTLAPIKVPRVVRPYNTIGTVQVLVDDKRAGQTETITDIGKLAVEQDEANFPYTLGRAIARRVVKKGVVYAAKEACQDAEELVEQRGAGRGRRGLGSDRIGRHALLGPAAGEDPGLAPGVAGRDPPNRFAAKLERWPLPRRRRVGAGPC